MGESYGNAFNALRLLAALTVLYGHSFPLYGLPVPVPVKGYSHGALAVYAFFVISGFLISRSWQTDPDLKRYWVKRGLRILPGLVVAVLFTALCVGTLVTTLPATTFLTHGDTWAYIANNATMVVSRFGLPGVFENNPFANAVNASLWTLRYEVLMYFLLSMAGWMFPSRWLRWAALVLLGFFAINRIYQQFENFDPTLMKLFSWKEVTDFGVFFFAGCCLNLFKIDTLKIYTVLLLIGLLTVLNNDLAILMVLWVLIPGSIVWMSNNAPSSLQKIGKHDISYGVYIYAFPIQQTCVYFALQQGVGWFFTLMVSLLLTLLFGLLSWKFIESPALRLKATVLRYRS